MTAKSARGLADRYAAMRPGTRSLLVFAIAALALFATMHRAANIFDEGIVYGGAMRVLAGQVVHRDFYSCYGPAVYWSVALLFKLTGPSFLAGRILGVATAAGCVALGHRLIAPRVHPLIALGGAALVTLWFMGIGSFFYSVYPCTLLALAGAVILAREQEPGFAALLGAGATAGFAALYRYDAGFFILLALIAVSTARAHGWRDALRIVLLLGVGAALVFLPVAIAHVAPDPAGTWQGFKADIIDYPLHYYARMRGMPWPGPRTLLALPDRASVYLPPLFVIAALPILRGEWRALRSRSEPGIAPVGLLLASLAVALYYKGTVRVSPMHMLMAIVPGFLLAMLVCERWTAAGGVRRLAARALCAALVLAGLSGLRDQLHYFRVDPRSSTWVWLAVPPGVHLPLTQRPAPGAIETCRAWAGMDYALLTDDYTRVAWYLSRHTPQAERVLVGLDRTDLYVINSMFLNYAMDRLPATHWSQFEPGLQSRAGIQREMVAELQRGDIRWIVRDGSGRDMKEPNGSALSSGVTMLDDYVDAHYRPIGRSGRVAVWLRRDLAAPSSAGDPVACRLPEAADGQDRRGQIASRIAPVQSAPIAQLTRSVSANTTGSSCKRLRLESRTTRVIQ